MDPSRCIVLVPVASYIEPECARGLAELQARGYRVHQVVGHSAIDQIRSQMACDALAAGYDEIMWIDSDVNFHPDSVDLLRSHELPVVCGVYAKKGLRELACHLLPETTQVIFGEGGGLLEILYAPAGFLLTHRSVYEKMREQEQLPICNQRFGGSLTPYFWPEIVPDGDGHWYLGEDYAFSERARRCGFTIMADTRIRLDHIGRIGYSWEEAGSDRPRYATYNFGIQR